MEYYHLQAEVDTLNASLTWELLDQVEVLLSKPVGHHAAPQRRTSRIAEPHLPGLLHPEEVSSGSSMICWPVLEVKEVEGRAFR